MNDNDQKEKNLRGIPGDLDERSKTDLREVWNIAGQTAESEINRLPDLTDAEIESALSQVQQRMGLASDAAITSDGSEPIYSSDSDHNTDDVRSSETRHRLVPARTPMWLFMRLSAAAAVLLMAYGTYRAATPVRYEAPYGQRLTIELPDGSQPGAVFVAQRQVEQQLPDTPDAEPGEQLGNARAGARQALDRLVQRRCVRRHPGPAPELRRRRTVSRRPRPARRAAGH